MGAFMLAVAVPGSGAQRARRGNDTTDRGRVRSHRCTTDYYAAFLPATVRTALTIGDPGRLVTGVEPRATIAEHALVTATNASRRTGVKRPEALCVAPPSGDDIAAVPHIWKHREDPDPGGWRAMADLIPSDRRVEPAVGLYDILRA
jgi:hypothetical protein